MKCETCGTACYVNPNTKRTWCYACVARGKFNEYLQDRRSPESGDKPAKKEKRNGRQTAKDIHNS
jgi:hypothetical protein